jgi:Cysteine-rich CPXCG
MGESGTLPGEMLGLQDMEDSFQVTCPYCGETVELFLESDVEGSLVQDCEVCCNPWQVQVWTEGGHRRVSVGRGWVGIAKVTSGPASARRPPP